MNHAWRYAASLAGLGVFAIMAMLGGNDATATLYARILYAWGMESFAFSYLDFAGYLSSLNCTRLGIDVIAGNPCDPLERQFNYGPLWLDLTFLPLYPPHRVLGGTLLAVVFLCALALLPPPRTARDAAITVAASLSGAVVFALERGNPDILIFLLTLAVARLAACGGLARGVGYALVWFAAGLKFFPAALLALALRERMARFILVAGLSVAMLGLYLLRYHQELARILPLLPVGNFDSDLFAAKNLPMRLGLVTQAGTGAAWAGLAAGGAILALLIARAVRTIRRLLGDPGFRAALPALPQATYLHLVSGALLIAFCFFAGQNIAYRGIFLLLALPGVLALRDVAGLRRAVPAVLFVLWEGTVRYGLDAAIAAMGLDPGTAFLVRFAYWLARELLWWWLASVLLAIILRFAWTSSVCRTLRRAT